MTCVVVRPGELGEIIAERPVPASPASQRRRGRRGTPWWRWMAAVGACFPGGGLAYHLVTQVENRVDVGEVQP